MTVKDKGGGMKDESYDAVFLACRSNGLNNLNSLNGLNALNKPALNP
jgi:hypothetical protein